MFLTWKLTNKRLTWQCKSSDAFSNIPQNLSIFKAEACFIAITYITWSGFFRIIYTVFKFMIMPCHKFENIKIC